MNTLITIQVVKPTDFSTIKVNELIDLAFGEFDRIVNKFTRFNENSELANLNRRSGEQTQVSEELFQLVDTMLDLAEKTEGAYDPTVIDFLEAYGYDKNYDFSKLDNPDIDAAIEKLAKERLSWQEIVLHPDSHSITLGAGQRLDLGGIGKGYAVDKAFAHLEPLKNFIIDAGGDVRALGHNDSGNKWKVSLKHQDKQGKEVIVGSPINLGSPDAKGVGRALASSGSWARKVGQFHHIIETKNGKPVQTLRTAFVTAPNATTADAWATALFVGGIDLLEKLPDGVEAMLIDQDDIATLTPGFELEV